MLEAIRNLRRASLGEAFEDPSEDWKGGFIPPSFAESGLSRLAAALCLPACTLKVLALDHNAIGDEGLKILLTGLSRNNSLEQLSLSYNQFTAVGAQLIAEALDPTVCVKLVSLNVQGNPFGGSGISLFAKWLTTNVVLKVINLASCKLENHDVDDIQNLCDALRANNCLEKLDLSYNEVSLTSAEMLLAVLEEKMNMKQMRITDILPSHIVKKFGEIMAKRNVRKKKKRGGGKKKDKKDKKK